MIIIQNLDSEKYLTSEQPVKWGELDKAIRYENYTKASEAADKYLRLEREAGQIYLDLIGTFVEKYA